jgi:NTP pyrophosphatase (non-canonical NTP hydrolase)
MGNLVRIGTPRRAPLAHICGRVKSSATLCVLESGMLAPLLATEDPYAAASIFSQAGWKVEYESVWDQEQPRACLSLARSRVELVPPSDPYIVPRGVGIEFQIHVPPRELSGLFLLHRAAGVVYSEMRERRPGERGFRAEIIGYRFLILGGDPDPDLALIATDPRIVALADGLRERDGEDALTDTALRLAEGSGESVKGLRLAMSEGLGFGAPDELGGQLAEVMIAAAILARQLGVDLENQVEAKLGSPTWNAEH